MNNYVFLNQGFEKVSIQKHKAAFRTFCLLPLLFSFVNLFCISCAARQDFGQVESEKEIYFFVDYPGKNFYFSNPSPALDILCQAIDNAQNSIEIALYELNQPRIIEALLKAWHRGVRLRVVGDWDERESNAYLLLQKTGIALVAGNKSGIQHNKFLIIDRQLLFSGSGNFTVNDFRRSTNHFVRIRSQKIIQRYLSEFEQMFAGKFGKDKISFENTENFEENNKSNEDEIHFQNKNDKKISVYFFPQDRKKALRHILHSIENARYSIHYMIFSFSQNQIASALIQASHSLTVEGIHDSTFIKGVSQQAPRLYAAAHDKNGWPLPNGPTVYQEGSFYTAPGNPRSGGKMHCKTMLIDAGSDKAVILIGSFNWSQNAMNVNDENLLIIEDNEAAKFLLQHYYQQRKAATPPQQLDATAGSQTLYMQDVVISEIGWGGSYKGRQKRTDFFLELYNRSAQEIDLAHWTLELQSSDWHVKPQNFRKRQFTFRGPGNSWRNAPSQKIPAQSYLLLYFNKDGHFSSLTNSTIRSKFLNASQLNWQNSASLRTRLYDKQMRLADEAVIFDNGNSGYFDTRNRKIASAERVGVSTSQLKEGKFFSSWYSSYTPDTRYPQFMFHSAGKKNSQETLGLPKNTIYARPPVAFAVGENKWQTFWNAPLGTCQLKKISLQGQSLSPNKYQNQAGGLAFWLNIPSTKNNIKDLPYFLNFQATACSGKSSIVSQRASLRFYPYQGDDIATVTLQEIHYDTQSGKDYLVLRVQKSGYLKETEIFSLTYEGYKQIYRFFPLYYNEGEKLKVYLGASLSQTQSSYDQSNTAKRTLNFYSLRRKLSRQDEVIFVRGQKQIHDMLFLSNRDGKMYAFLKEEIVEISLHPLWPFSAANQSMSKKQLQTFALDVGSLKNTNSYQKVNNVAGWKFVLQNISP